jgi:lysophospholipase L1-like esterase
MNSRDSAEWTDSSGTRLESTMTKANYAALHTAALIGIAYFCETTTQDVMLLDELRLSSGRIGFSIAVTSAGAVKVQIANGSAYVIDLTTADGVIHDHRLNVIVVEWKATNAPDVSVRVNGIEEASGNFANAPSGGNSDLDLMVGNIAYDPSNIASYTAQGDILEVLAYTDWAFGFEPDRGVLAVDIEQYFYRRWQPRFHKAKVMLCGDSITKGGNTGGYRPLLWTAVLARHGLAVDFVGSQSFGYVASGNYTLGDWDECAFAGYTIEEVQPYLLADIETYRPDAIYLGLGTNNVGRDESSATILARFETLFAAVKATGRIPMHRVYVTGMVPWNCAVDSAPVRAAREVVRVAVNSGLDAVCAEYGATRVVVADLLTTSDLDTDGVHPQDSTGYPKMATKWASLFDRDLGGFRLGGDAYDVVPRAFAAHSGVTHFRMTDDSDTLTIPTHATMTPSGSGSMTYAWWAYPIALVDPTPSAFRVLWQRGSPYSAGITVAQVGTTGEVIVCVDNGTAQFDLPARLTQFEWTRFVLSLDAVAGTATLYANGQFCGTFSTTWNLDAGDSIIIGTRDSRPAFRGVIADFVCCAGRAATYQETMVDYYGSMPGDCRLEGVTAYYPLHDSSLAAATGGGGNAVQSGGMWWAAAMPGG